MSQHPSLGAGRWAGMSFLEQMANIGSEVERAIQWRQKNNGPYSLLASERALELIDLTLDATKTTTQRREVARVREVFVDFFFLKNEYESTDQAWKNYFTNFACAARKDRTVE